LPFYNLENMNIKKTCAAIFLILLVAITAGFARNYFNPKGIALFGQWDKEKGAISALSKDMPLIPVSLEIKTISEAKEIFDGSKTLFVDARGAEIYKEGHVKGAVSLPVDDFHATGQSFLEKYSPATAMIVYCSGRECEDSHTLAGYLKDLGYANIRIMVDGYPGWEKGGYPVEKN